MRRMGREMRAEIVRVARHRPALLLFVGAVLLYGFFYPLPYAPEVIRQIPVGVVDLDRSAGSRQLLRALDVHESLRVTIQPSSREEAEQRVRAGDISGYVVIPPDYARALARGEAATVQVAAEAANLLVYRQVLGGLTEVVTAVSAAVEVGRNLQAGLNEAQARAAREPVSLVIRPLFNSREGYGAYVAPAALLLILQQSLLIGLGVLGAGSVDGARRSWGSAWPRLVARVGGLTTLYLGHALFYLLVVFRVYGYPRHGDVGTTLLFLLPFFLATTLLGIAVSAWFRAPERAMQALLFTSMPALFLAGVLWPVDAMPAALVWLGRLFPTGFGIEGFVRVSQMGASLHQVLPAWGGLWGLVAIYWGPAWWAMRREGAEPVAGEAATPHRR